METEKEFMPTVDRVVSLSFDQVDSNPDALIELRGEGRYFGVTDPDSKTDDGPLCANCHQPGHRRNKCTTVVCHACGVVGDHYTQRCPKSMVCYNCGEKGHYGNSCSQRARRLFCQTCESTRHMGNRCPSIWRSYLTKNDGGSKANRAGLPNNMYCYNCADKGHYGDDCPLPRSSRMPNVDGSAFSGHNLPQNLREAYHKLQKKRKRDERNGDEERGHGKKKLLDRVKGVFKNNKDQGQQKGRQQQLSKARSLPAMRKSGYLEPERFQDQRTESYRGQGRRNYGNSNYHNDGGYPRPSRSGTYR